MQSGTLHITLGLLKRCVLYYDIERVLLAERWVPEEEAGPWSQMFFSYATGLIKLGKQKALRPEDLWDISYRDEASNVSQVHLNSSLLTKCLEHSLAACSSA